MATYVPPKRATAFKFYVGLVSQANTKTLQVNPTIGAGDFKVSKDGGAFANLSTLPSVNPPGGTAVMIDLSSTEITADNLTVACIDAAGAEWCDMLVNIQTAARQIDDLAFPATSGRSMVVDAAGLVDANTVKVGPTGSGTAQTAGDIPARLPTALSGGGNMKSDVLEVNDSTNSAANLSRGTLANVLGTVGSASTTTSIVTSSLDPAAAVADQYKGRIITFDRATTTTNLRGQATDITANTSGGVLTVTALTNAPVSGDTFTIT